MTRKELQAIKKSGLRNYRGPKQPDGYCEVALIMKIRWGSIRPSGSYTMRYVSILDQSTPYNQ